MKGFSGHDLCGERLVRFAYLDEAGIGSVRQEPFLVVAGVVFHPDVQGKALETYLNDMADELRPAGTLPAPFHAKDIWHGSRAFSREVWPRELREQLLRELVSIPAKFAMAIPAGFVDRTEFARRFPDMSPGDSVMYGHTLAFVAAACQVEHYMRRAPAEAPELAAIVCEHNDQAHKLIRQVQDFLRHPYAAMLEGTVRQYVPFTRIWDQAFFATKGSGPLAVADACAFIIKRHLQGARDTEELYEALAPNMIMRPRQDLAGASLARPS